MRQPGGALHPHRDGLAFGALAARLSAHPETAPHGEQARQTPAGGGGGPPLGHRPVALGHGPRHGPRAWSAIAIPPDLTTQRLTLSPQRPFGNGACSTHTLGLSWPDLEMEPLVPAP